jgi:hypothetical protein
VVQVVECLLSKYKTLSSNPSAGKGGGEAGRKEGRMERRKEERKKDIDWIPTGTKKYMPRNMCPL